MSEYYAVQRSDEYLAHYGVRGMKWGVRKAVAQGDTEKLRKQYKKAAVKLAKLSLNANQDAQKKRYAQAKNNMVAGSGISGALSAATTMGLNSHLPLGKRALLAAGAGAAGALAGAAINSKGFSARKYVSDKGHARAIAKRNAWRKEMESAFKGTQYGGKAQKQFHKDIMGLSNAKRVAVVRGLNKANRRKSKHRAT